MRQKEIKYFGDIQSGRLNSDDSPFAVTTNEWVNAENVRTGTTDKGATGIVESVGGNVLLNQAFPSVTIGSQEWMLYNLDVTTYRNGDPIPEVTDEAAWTLLTTGAWCYIYNDPANGIPYGKLYNAYAVNDPRGLAPEGWHIPSNTEMIALSTYLGGGAVAGGKLKDTDPSFWTPPNTGATNESGFTARGAGYRDSLGGFDADLNISTYYWTSTETGSDNYFSTLNNTSTIFTTNSSEDQHFGWSVRCVKDLNQYITIGTIEDTENKRICYFEYDDSAAREDKIVCIYTETNTIYNLLLSSQVTGGLNFDKYSLIHSAKITEGLLSWTDGDNNEPRKINIESAIVANYPGFVTEAQPYSFPLNFWEITVIKPPPIYCPNIVNEVDSTYPNNFIATFSFEFAFQYQYYDNETTVVGSYTYATRLAASDSSVNLIRVSMDGNETIPNTVKKINLIVRLTDGNSNGGNNAFVTKTWDKESTTELAQIENQNNGTQVLVYNFYNNISGAYLAPDDVLRPFDNVPIYSQTHEIAKSRYFFANNTEGYDTPLVSSLGVAFQNNGGAVATTVTLQVYLITFKSAGQTGGSNIDPSKQWAYQGYCVFDGQNYLLIPGTGNYTLGSNTPIPAPTAFTSPISYTSAFTPLGGTVRQTVLRIHPVAGVRPPIATTDGTTYMDWSVSKIALVPNTWITITNFPSATYGIFAQQSPYKFGTVFYDYAMRKCGVVAPKDQDEYTQIYSYIPSTAVTTNVKGTAPHTIITNLSSMSLGILNVGDQIIISGTGSALDGITYDIVGLGSNLNVITVSQTVPTTINFVSPTYPVVIDVYRRLVVDITTPTGTPLTAQSSIRWNLSNVNAVNEIPDWAYYYTVVRTLNLRTRYFIQNYVTGGGTDAIKYCTRNNEGVWSCTSNVIQNAEAIGLPINGLLHNGLGYSYDKANGDICILQTYGVGGVLTPQNLPVIGQDGNFILVKFVDLGVSASSTINGIDGMTAYYEVYTPYKALTQEPYYEMGEIYPILNPGEISRSYSALNGNLRGDCARVERFPGVRPNNNFFALAMCANDLYYQRWDNDGGKINVITQFGRSQWGTYVSYSDAIISGSQINGTSTFRAGNYVAVPSDCGNINKLQLTSKIQNEGNVMLSLCTVETNSMYLGETQITDSTGGTKFFSGAVSVIGTINTLKGNYGCISPESVVQYRGHVYFFDANSGRWVQYSENGLDAISSIKMVRFWKNWANKYLSMTKVEIEDFGDRPYVFAAIDAGHDELLISIPKLSDEPPKGFLPDYPGMIYPFDILDYQGKTIVYKLGTGAVVTPHWQGAYTFTTEYFATVQNRLFTFKNGLIWEHNQGNQNEFFGAQYPSKIMFTSNMMPQVPKVYDNFLSESNLIPNFVYFYNEYPYLQSSDLEDISFVDLEGIWYANILRNKIIPTTTGDVYTGLLTAEVMRNTNMYVLAEYSPTTNPLQLRLLQLGFSISKGHNI